MRLTDSRHIRGFLGEHNAGFALGKRNFAVLEGPSGSFKDRTGSGTGGHNVTARGFDAVAIGKESKHILIVEQKAHVTERNVASASAIDQNAIRNLEKFIKRVPSHNHPDEAHILHELNIELKSLKNGGPGSNYVHWGVTGEYGPGVKGVTDRLDNKDIKYVDLSQAKSEWEVIAVWDQSPEVLDKVREAREQADRAREVAETKDRELRERLTELRQHEDVVAEDRERVIREQETRQLEAREVEELEARNEERLSELAKREAQEKVDQEAREKADRDAQEQTKREAQEKAEREAQERAEREQGAAEEGKDLAIDLDPEQLAAEINAKNNSSHESATAETGVVDATEAITEVGFGSDIHGWFGHSGEHR